MDYITMRARIEDIVNDNHRDFIKAMISIEKGINDESVLDKLYDAYMDNDSLNVPDFMSCHATDFFACR